MAQAALRNRDSVLVDLHEAIRQAERYTNAANQSVRIINKKILKVEEVCESYKAAQYAYCQAANIDLNAEENAEEKASFHAEIDQATDCCDNGLLLVDQLEQADATAAQTNLSAAQATQQQTEKATKSAQLKAILKSDVEFVEDIIQKVETVIDGDTPSESNAALLNSYNETLQHVNETVTTTWKDLIATVPTAELDGLAVDLKITEMKVSIQSAISTGLSFIERCKPKVPPPQTQTTTTTTTTPSTISHSLNTLRTQKASFPTFGGDVRSFARFQKDFQTIVIPANSDPKHQAYVLKSECLKDDVKKCVENIDDVSEIWKRLEEKYGNKHDLVDVVVKDLGSVPKLNQNDDVEFISLVDMLEKGLQDLGAINARHELANTYTVTRVEEKLSRETYHEWLKEEDKIEGDSRFDKLFSFLKEERRRVEKIVQRNPQTLLKTKDEKKKRNREHCNRADGGGVPQGGDGEVLNHCLIHPKAHHFTRKCRSFLQMKEEEMVNLVRTTSACPLCLSITHIGKTCPFKSKWGPCNIDQCTLFHARALHKAIVVKKIGTELCASVTVGVEYNTLLLVQEIQCSYGEVKSLFDNGSTISLISKSFVVRHGLRGIRVAFELITVGGTTTTQYSYLHIISLFDANGNEHIIKAYQIDEICGEMKGTNLVEAANLFSGLSANDVQRKNGHIELLIGAKHLPIHPDKIKSVDDLVLYRSIFGTQRLLAGTHPLIGGESDTFNPTVQRVAHARMSNVRVMCQKDLDPGIDFFTQESFGVQVIPSCDECMNCQNCTLKVHQMSKVERDELKVIENNLVLDPVEECWTTPYPFTEDPSVLQDNRDQALKFMEKIETRLNKSQTKAAEFRKQFDDYVNRGVFRLLTDEEMSAHTGPVFYVTYHEVEKEDSATTPLRIVMNSSLKYRGKSLNDILMKGPNTLSDLFKIQLKFRCYVFPMVCDIKKMYHSIKTTNQELHLRRIVYRDLDPSKPVKTYGITTVNFGDRSAGTIATVALHKTAQIYQDINKEASQKIQDDSYVDDITTGAEDEEGYQSLKKHVPEILSKGNFSLKGIITAGESNEEAVALLGAGEYGRVLGIQWDPEKDVLLVKVRINFSKKERNVRTGNDLSLEEIPTVMTLTLTRRLLLSVVNSCYDPYGVFVPLTIQMKILLRNLHGKEANLTWDEPLSDEIKSKWVEVLIKIKEAENTTFRRCVKLNRKAVGKPILIICTDGSEDAMCATAHIRWKFEDGSVHVLLWAAKSRVTPLVKLTIPRIEMSASVLGVRLSKAVQESSIWEFEEIVHIIDASCVLATLKNNTTALGEWWGNRIQECLNSTDISQWWHIRSKLNIADLGTRTNATVVDINEQSEWQNGPAWMYLPRKDWPITQEVTSQVPNDALVRRHIAAHATVVEPLIPYSKYTGKSYQFIINLTARVLKVGHSKSFKITDLTPEDLEKAEQYVIKSSMKMTRQELKKGHLASLRPEENENGVICLNSRALEGLQTHYDNKEFPILCEKDPVAYLWMKKVHWEDHSGVTRTVAKSRRKFWITHARKLASRIKHFCFVCRLLDKMLAQQIMAPLPTSRLRMSPTFHEISIDLFGPYEIKDTVKGRSRKKVWGFVLSCLASRAIHIDVTEDYSMDSALQTLSRFMSLRGRPARIVSDKGSQLVAASEDLKRLQTWAAARSIKWHTVPAEGQHQNGASEALINSIKRSLTHIVGNQTLTFAGLQTVFYEVATLINARPIGIVSGSDPTCPMPITPNHLLLGRSTPDVAHGLFDNDESASKRQIFLQSLVEDWWKNWYRNVLPSLVPSYKWRQKHRNVCVGDVCLIKYTNMKRGTYRLGRVTSVRMGKDNKVRTVSLQYKNPKENVFREVERPIQGIAVIVPVEEQSNLNPAAEEFTPQN